MLPDDLCPSSNMVQVLSLKLIVIFQCGGIDKRTIEKFEKEAQESGKVCFQSLVSYSLCHDDYCGTDFFDVMYSV